MRGSGVSDQDRKAAEAYREDLADAARIERDRLKRELGR